MLMLAISGHDELRCHSLSHPVPSVVAVALTIRSHAAECSTAPHTVPAGSSAAVRLHIVPLSIPDLSRTLAHRNPGRPADQAGHPAREWTPSLPLASLHSTTHARAGPCRPLHLRARLLLVLVLLIHYRLAQLMLLSKRRARPALLSRSGRRLHPEGRAARRLKRAAAPDWPASST
jgi:hypothetical protein